MNISIELLITIGSFAFLVAAFFVTRSRDMADKQRNMISDAEDKGRLLQRIDQLEKSVDDAHGKCRDNTEMVTGHENELTKVTGDINSLQALMERVEKKLDRVLEKSQAGI